MGGNPIERLAGMRDISGVEYNQLLGASSVFEALASKAGYEMIDTPMMEQTELFVRKSGGELTTQLYSFTDPSGNRVSLRPEFTSSVIRYFIDSDIQLSKPSRWQYKGPVFRHEDALRQFTQVGAEFIGSSGIDSDVEIVNLALESLAAMGITSYTLCLGHVGVLQDLLGIFGLSESAKLFVFNNIQDLKYGITSTEVLLSDAKRLGITRENSVTEGENTIASLETTDVRELFNGVIAAPMSNPMGRRSTEDVVARLLRKVREADLPDKLGEALSVVNQIVKIKGAPSDAIGRAREILNSKGLNLDVLDQVSDVTTDLISQGVDDSLLVVDFGVTRGISYYTGIIFDVEVGNVSMGGGGRYDNLVKALGGPDTPALGFAYSLESVVAKATYGSSDG